MVHSLPSWGVVATVCEPAELLVAFAAHHLDLGAARVHFYLDTPHPVFRALVAHDPRIAVTDCNERFYNEALNRRRPPGINRRQIVNADHAESVTDVDWLFHLDADEYLTQADPAIELAQLPDDIMALKVPNGERVFARDAKPVSVFEGFMALPIAQMGVLTRMRGANMARYTRGGLMGHTLGKSAVRVGHGHNAGIHAPKLPGDRMRGAQDLLMCHFDGLTRLHWVAKMLRHIDNNLLHGAGRGRSDYRTEQLKLLRNTGGRLEAVFGFHDQMRVVPPRAARKLRARGWLLETGVSPDAAIARQFPGLLVDLSINSFDNRLFAQFPQLAGVAFSEAA